MSGSYTQTANLGLFKPTPNSDTGSWGYHLNSNADTLDALLVSTGTSVTFLPIAGGTLTGSLTLNADPTASLGAATKHYVDTAIAGGVSATYLPLAGGTLTGALILNADPATALGAATRQYADGVINRAGGPFLALAGGTVSGTTNFSAPLNVGSNTARQTLSFNGPIGAFRPITWQTAGSNRFQITCNNVAEGSGNTGSDLDFACFDNTGNPILNPAMRWTRATGVFNYYGGVSVISGALTFHQAVQGATIAGASLSGSTTGGFQQSLSASGTYSGSGYVGYNQWNVPSDVMAAATAAFPWHTAINYNYGGGAFTGNRGGLLILMSQAGAGSGSSGAGGIEGFQVSTLNQYSYGGTGIGAGQAAGNIFPANLYATLRSGAQNYLGVTGMEIDIECQSGCSYQSATGMSVVSTAAHQQPAANQTLAYAVGGQGGTPNSLGFDVAFDIAALGMRSTGTLIRSSFQAAQGNFPVARGIDLRSATFSSDIFAARNVAIDTTGRVRVGTGYLDANASGAILDAAGAIVTAGTLTAPATTAIASDGNNYWCDDPYGGIWKVTFASGTTSISAIAIELAAVVNGAPPANPVTLTPKGYLKMFLPGTITANLTWDTTRKALSLSPSGGVVTINAGCTITSGSVAPAATQPAGSIYMRTGGASGGRLYVSAGGGTWTAVAGV